MTTLDALRVHLHRTAAARRAPAKPALLPRCATHSRGKRIWTEAELAVLSDAASVEDAMQRLPGRSRRAVGEKMRRR